ncbi:hypothetical protein ABIA33_004776 [Streptacidiphilus sp. MAP12-16]|uniref:hypothetical protein n=1 Tax=Streptacidiphilus sp. MAP12-16 TaxID=3156300 RepID=UPI0035147C45
MSTEADPVGRRPPERTDWYARAPQEVARVLGVDPQIGLSAARRSRRATAGS